jgi:GntR family transcriptional regulator, carbon starvation induced regulator
MLDAVQFSFAGNPRDAFSGGQTLADEAYRAIKSDIVRGVRAPGERLRIERLRTIYHIGPTPLREALQRLSADRLVITEGNRGFAVAPFDAEEFTDLNTARIAVEKEALRLSLRHGGIEWESGVVAAAYVMEREDRALPEVAGPVPDSWEQANAGFHASLVAACGSKWLLWTRSHLHDLCERYRRAAVANASGNRALHLEHSDLMKAALARDAEAVCALTERHYSRTAQIFEQMVRR